MTTMIQDLQAYVAANGNNTELWEEDASGIIFRGTNSNGDRLLKYKAALKAGYIKPRTSYVDMIDRVQAINDESISLGHVRVTLPESLI